MAEEDQSVVAVDQDVERNTVALKRRDNHHEHDNGVTHARVKVSTRATTIPRKLHTRRQPAPKNQLLTQQGPQTLIPRESRPINCMLRRQLRSGDVSLESLAINFKHRAVRHGIKLPDYKVGAPLLVESLSHNPAYPGVEKPMSTEITPKPVLKGFQPRGQI
jgi:hypothetical protein